MGDATVFSERDVVAAVNELKNAVNKFSEDSAKQGRRLFWLTVTIACLTIVIAILTAMMVFPELADYLRDLFRFMPLQPGEGL